MNGFRRLGETWPQDITVAKRSRRTQDWQKIKTLFGSDLLVYYGQYSELQATDLSGNGRHGVPANIFLGTEAGPSGLPMLRFTGTNGEQINISAAGAVFPTSEGFTWLWGKAFNGAFWTDGATHTLLYLLASGSNYNIMQKSSTNNTLSGSYNAGGTLLGASPVKHPSGLFCFGVSWSVINNRVRLWWNGEQWPSLQSYTGLGVWAGTIGTALLGASSVAGRVWNGWIGDMGMVGREPTALEVRNICRFASRGGIYRLSIIGDSISSNLTQNYAELTSQSWQDGSVGLNNHSIAGHKISDDMAVDCAAAANDYANVIIIALGTNDDNAGDMTALQTTYEAGISALKTNNPSATIYAMNVLPRWTDSGGGTPVDKSNIRAAIAAACAAQDITCWDTYTSPWITAAQTSDGLHPIAAGHTALATQVLARL